MTEKEAPRWTFLLSLIASSFASMPPGQIISLFLIDIAETFSRTVGEMGQLSAFSSFVGLFTALGMGVLSMRVQHRKLLLAGNLALIVCSLGCYYSSSYLIMLVFFSLSGLALSVISPMNQTLIGEYYPLSKRSEVLSLLAVGATFSGVVGAPIISWISGFGGWRSPFAYFSLPCALAGIILVYLYIPSNPDTEVAADQGGVLSGMKGILKNRSATAMLTSSFLTMAAWQSMFLYASSFYREVFLVSTDFASYLVLWGNVMMAASNYISGRISEKVGLKKLAVASGTLSGLFMFGFYSSGDLWVSISLRMISLVFGGMSYNAALTLTLEQTAEYRGAMMSLNRAAFSLGSTLGAMLGGYILINRGYTMLGGTIGILMVIAAIIVWFISRDPNII